MRAILLAAGRGSRLRQNDDEAHPKCLLRFDGRTLLERHLLLLDAVGVTDVVLALGWRHEAIEAELERLGRRASVEIVMNPRYELGSVLTVHTAVEPMTRGGDVLLMDADVLYDGRMLRTLTSGDGQNRLLIDRGFQPGDEPVKVCVEEGTIVEFRKRLPEDLAYDTIGESVGFFRFREDTAAYFMRIVAEYVDGGRANLPHEEAIRDLLLEGEHRFDVADVTGAPWIEIDFPADVDRATQEILPALEPLAH